ncbi:MAG: cell division protein FtsA [Tannerella sp.]|jgi:cell division protein FtsA|nr:cell division protein FtsA [Tannerella sp.]
MTDFIVAIDLGTSHMTGIVGEKNADGTFTIVACETENPLSCMRRGNIHNLDDTADRAGRLVNKLESHLKGGYIDKVYIGVGGQSLRTINHVESKEIAEGAVVTKDDIKELKERCEKNKPDLLDVLDTAPAVYYLDGRRETKPVGVPCKRFEARYKLVIGRSSIRRDIHNSIRDRMDKEIAGIMVTPLALADAMLSREEKELGCALVDFGAGVTSVSVYKDSDLLHMSVIPLGSNLITRDIVSLQLTETEAEKLKKEYGSAIVRKEDEDESISVNMEGADRKIEINDLNAIIEGRAKEIVENVYARISEVTELKSLGSGIVLAGCAAELKGLLELIRDKCKVKVRHSAICEGPVSGLDDRLGNPLYMPAISLMLKGTESCVSLPFVESEPKPEQNESVAVNADVKEKEKKEKENKGGKKPRKNVNNGKTWRDIFGEYIKKGLDEE